jgi:hypothetical protein
MATLSRVLHRIGRYEPSATIAGFALTPFAVASVPELRTTTAHLRHVLGDQDDESFARTTETMSTAEKAASAYVQIDQARAALTDIPRVRVEDGGDMPDITDQR